MKIPERTKALLKKLFTRRRLIRTVKILGWVVLYSGLFLITVYFTMYSMIKIDELEVPRLVGMGIDEARDYAREQKFRLKKKAGYFQGNYPPLTIIDQYPEPGMNIKKNSFVTVYVTADVDQVEVVDLTGFSISEAERMLEDQNLRKRYISYMETTDIPSNLVIAQSYAPGEMVNIRTGIDLLVSKGKRRVSYVMPDLIGKSLDEVSDFLSRWDLKIAESRIKYVEYPLTPPGVIISQSPKPGFRINSNNLIDLKVSR